MVTALGVTWGRCMLFTVVTGWQHIVTTTKRSHTGTLLKPAGLVTLPDLIFFFFPR